MIGIIIVAAVSGAAFGIALYALRKAQEVQHIIDLYESHMIDFIEEIKGRNNESGDNQREGATR